MARNLTRLLDSFISDFSIPFNDCIVYHKGEEVYRYKNGYSDYEKLQRVTGKEKYNIYSCSKPITCATALILWEKGDLKLDEPLYTYIPEFKTMYVRDSDDVRKSKNDIIIKDLFTMSAGFNYDLNSECLNKARTDTLGKCPTVETIKYLSQAPLDFEPGSTYRYSLCHDVLAAVVEVVSGMRFGEYVKKNIFDKLQMNNTTYWKNDFEISEISAQYRFNAESNEYENCGTDNVYRLGELYESGGAGCVSTVDDYIKFLEAMRIGDIILKKDTIKMMSANQLQGEALRFFKSRENSVSGLFEKYGYGLGVRCPHTDKTITNFGWDGAAGAYLAIDIKNEITFFYAQQVLNSPNWVERSRLVKCVNEMFA